MPSVRSCALMRAAFAVTALVFSGCGGSKAPLRVLPPEPRDSTSSALGVTLSLAGGSEVASPPTIVVFARFDDPARDAEALQRATLVESNFVDGNHYYLLNAAPGAYAVVGARSTSKYKGAAANEQRPRATDSLETSLSFSFGTEHTRHDEIWFAREVIAATLVDVPAGAFTFAGEVEVAVTKALGVGDAAQSVLLARRQSTAALSVSGSTVHREGWFGGLAGVHKDADAAARFRDATHPALGSAEWSARLRAGHDPGAPH